MTLLQRLRCNVSLLQSRVQNVGDEETSGLQFHSFIRATRCTMLQYTKIRTNMIHDVFDKKNMNGLKHLRSQGSPPVLAAAAASLSAKRRVSRDSLPAHVWGINTNPKHACLLSGPPVCSSEHHASHLLTSPRGRSLGTQRSLSQKNSCKRMLVESMEPAAAPSRIAMSVLATPQSGMARFNNFLATRSQTTGLFRRQWLATGPACELD